MTITGSERVVNKDRLVVIPFTMEETQGMMQNMLNQQQIEF